MPAPHSDFELKKIEIRISKSLPAAGRRNNFEFSKFDSLAKSLKRRFLSFLRKQESSIFMYLKFSGFPPACGRRVLTGMTTFYEFIKFTFLNFFRFGHLRLDHLSLFRISPACAKPLRRRQGFRASDLESGRSKKPFATCTQFYS
jgi:hypothetical protein